MAWTTKAAICLFAAWGGGVTSVQNPATASAAREFDAQSKHKSLWTIGVLANRGAENAYQQFNATFADYLTASVGQNLDPPVAFRMTAIDFRRSIDDAIASTTATGEEDRIFDFFFVNPSIQSCIESEVGSYPLATLINKRIVGGVTYDLDEFAGVIFTKADNHDINHIADIREKRAACVSVTGLGSGQMQFQELQRAGMHHLQDVKQLVFASTQGNVVNAVLDGLVDVGFVRTDQLERSVNASSGEPLDMSKLKIINAQDRVDNHGAPFPFTVSTDLFPEWGFSALPHVPQSIIQQVQRSLLDVGLNAMQWSAVEACMLQHNCTDGSSCELECHDELTSQAAASSCSADAGAARLAHKATVAGEYAGFRTALNYMQLRNMQEQTGFIQTPKPIRSKNGDTFGHHDVAKARCVRPTEFADTIVCPEGYKKKSDEGIANGCADIGLNCGGHRCLCKPCVWIEVCENGSVTVGSHCIRLPVLLASILVPFAIIVLSAAMVYARYISHKADSLWRIKASDLQFDDPPHVLGHGAFGLVVRAELRGTKVAVKRVLPVRRGRQPHGSVREEKSPFDRAGAGASEAGFEGISDVESPPGESHRGITTPMSYANGSNGQQLKKRTSLNAMKGLPERLGYSSGFFPSSAKGRRSLAIESTNWRKKSWMATNKHSHLRANFIEEMRKMSKLRHPCITTVMGAVIGLNTEPMLVMELMELGSLYDFLHNQTVKLEEKMAIAILQDIAQGVRFLHCSETQIIHGDLKSVNILVDTRFRAKVADFGFSQKRLVQHSASGTPFWMAPELLRGETPNTIESDIYSFGVLMHEVVTRKDPYEDDDHLGVLKDIADRHIQRRPKVPSDCPIELRFLMQECWSEDSSMRPSATSIDQRLRQINVAETDASSASKNAVLSQEIVASRFPPAIATALMEGRKVEPTTHHSVSVLCCEIACHEDLLQTASTTRFSKLMSSLREIFHHLCDLHEVFPIETVGSGFLAATNIALDQPYHAAMLADFALEVMESFAKASLKETHRESIGDSHDQDHQPSFHRRDITGIRVGMHTGSVVSHVVGTHSPRFAVLGDTVRLVDLLQSCAKPNMIHVSRDFAFELIGDSTELQLHRVDNPEICRKVGTLTYALGCTGGGGDDRSAHTEDTSLLSSHSRQRQSHDAAGHTHIHTHAASHGGHKQQHQ